MSAPAQRIAIPDWMTPRPLQRLLDVLEDSRFVGGAVRDTLLGRSVGDLDLATPLTPPEVTRRLEAAGFRVIPTGLQHGTVSVVLEGGKLEITTLRRDVETDGRHAVVAFTDDWEEDARRRDFTMNALYLDRDGGVWDPLGEGLTDLAAGHVRFVGDAGARIEEDVLRILRFYRFQAHYGRSPVDAETRLACCRRAGALSALSGERIREELLKLLRAPDPMASVTALAEDAIWRKIGLPEPVALNRLKRLIKIEDTPDPLRRLASLLRDGVDQVVDRLRLANAERSRLSQLVGETIPDWNAPEIAHRHALYRSGPALYRDLAMLAVARGRDAAPLAGFLALAHGWVHPPLPIRGADLIEIGMTPGPEISTLLKAVETWWMDGDFAADRPACLIRAQELRGRAAADLQ